MIQSVAFITIGSPLPRVDEKPTLAEQGFDKNLARQSPANSSQYRQAAGACEAAAVLGNGARRADHCGCMPKAAAPAVHPHRGLCEPGAPTRKCDWPRRQTSAGRASFLRLIIRTCRANLRQCPPAALTRIPAHSNISYVIGMIRDVGIGDSGKRRSANVLPKIN
jgi:hypothetical protein